MEWGGKVTDETAVNLNELESPQFYVCKRSLRDRLNLLINRYKANIKEENLARGISQMRLKSINCRENLVIEEQCICLILLVI